MKFVRLKKPLVAQFLLAIGFLGAFGFLGHLRGLYFQEVAEVCVLALFVWLALSTRMKGRGALFVFLSAFGVAFLVLLYAYVFSSRIESASLLPSVLAQRTYIFFLLAPVIYMLYMRGWRLAEFQRLFVSMAFITVIGYALAILIINPESWSSSGDFYKESLVTCDELRGCRLKGPLFLLLFVALYFGRRAFQTRDIASFVLRSMATVLPIAIIGANSPRSTVLATIIALVVYSIFLSRAERIRMSSIILPLLVWLTVLSVPYLSNVIATTFSGDWSYLQRIATAERAWQVFLEYPLLGLGQASYQSVSYQALLGDKFHPSDIGLLGIAFQYGLIGLFVYLFFGLWIILNLLKLLYIYAANAAPKQSTFLWALFIICLSFVIVSPLQPSFIVGEGIAIGAFCWGLLMAHKHNATLGPRRNPYRYARPDTVIETVPVSSRRRDTR